MQMSRYRIRRSKINHIFISHLHGDHYFGLIGLLTSMGLLGREQELHLHAPAPLNEILDLQLRAGSTSLPFSLHFHPLKAGIVINSDKFEVSCFRVLHRIDCWGFVFKEIRPPRKINGVTIKQYDIPVSFYDQLRWGHDYLLDDGRIITNASVTEPALKGKTYAYTADTAFDESLACHVKGVDMLYHETTYLKALADQAAKRFHCTTAQAAEIARKAEVQRLIIGHFSSKYEKLDQFEQEAREIFPNTDLALEGVTYRV